MKTLKTIAAALLLLPLSFTSSAQTTADASASYNRATVMFQTRGLGGITTNGFALGYVHGFNLSQDMPLFFQSGLKMDMGFNSSSASESFAGSTLKADVKVTTMSFSVPLDIAYQLQCGESTIFTPYIGLNVKLNTLARMSAKASYGGSSDKGSASLFDNGMKHFQIGWHIGAGVTLSKVYLGAEFGTDFIAVADGGNHTPTFSVGIGYTF